VDITHPNANEQAKAVYQALEEIDAAHIPVLVALNKIDKLSDPEKARQSLVDFPHAVALSAVTGDGILDLLNATNEQLFENYLSVSVLLPYEEDLISIFHYRAGED
jgi:GTP-binding protein HflX